MHVYTHTRIGRGQFLNLLTQSTNLVPAKPRIHEPGLPSGSPICVAEGLVSSFAAFLLHQLGARLEACSNLDSVWQFNVGCRLPKQLHSLLCHNGLYSKVISFHFII